MSRTTTSINEARRDSKAIKAIAILASLVLALSAIGIVGCSSDDSSKGSQAASSQSSSADSSQSTAAQEEENPFVGTWFLEEASSIFGTTDVASTSLTFDIREDGTWEFVQVEYESADVQLEERSSQGTWTAEGDLITLSPDEDADDIEMIGEIDAEGNLVVSNFLDGEDVTFVKQQ